jgi:hypothetical protein
MDSESSKLSHSQKFSDLASRIRDRMAAFTIRYSQMATGRRLLLLHMSLNRPLGEERNNGVWELAEVACGSHEINGSQLKMEESNSGYQAEISAPLG